MCGRTLEDNVSIPVLELGTDRLLRVDFGSRIEESDDVRGRSSSLAHVGYETKDIASLNASENDTVQGRQLDQVQGAREEQPRALTRS